MQLVKLIHFNTEGHEISREEILCPRRQDLPRLLLEHHKGDSTYAFSPAGKRIGTYPKDTRGGSRPCPSYTIDGVKRPYKITFRVAEDVWNILQRQQHRADYIHDAIRFYNNNGEPAKINPKGMGDKS